MTDFDNMLAMVREARDALQAQLAADERWQHLQRLNRAIAALEGESADDHPVGVGMSATSTLKVGVKRPPAEDLEDRGTNPLVLAILAEDPTRVWRVETLLLEMNERGWETDAENRRNALGTALLRLAKREEIEKVGRGRYRAALATPEAQPDGLDAEEDESTPDEDPEPVDWGTVPSWGQERDMDG
ncbi:hypothetical protein [Knoellia sp. Soil729]|uniref:hypothetical protein n=1 Tax=Knoellia sp. Soil729 TaxID=1736394 RepID=UPI0006FE8B59|nr:hypothetical protein [Knoellia sp. Soil729]KRE44055.1 hypothetical protein ASG74_04340 [Knoellia sp. Soil729]